jgi:hypothetical protein
MLSFCCPPAPPPPPLQRTLLANAHNELVANRLFGGLDYPTKLESYTHRHQVGGPAGGMLGGCGVCVWGAGGREREGGRER